MASWYHPATNFKDILTEEPGASRQKLKQMIALRYKAESDIELRDDLRSLPVQSSLIKEKGDNQWLDMGNCSEISADRVMKFALSDTLPYRANPSDS